MGPGIMSDGDDDRKPMLQHLYHPDQMHHMKVHHHVMQDDHHQDCGIPLPPTKPKIWSLADTAASKTPPPGHQWPNVSPSLASPGFTMPNSSLSPSGSSYSRYNIIYYRVTAIIACSRQRRLTTIHRQNKIFIE